MPNLKLRGTFGTSFRAPSFTETRQGPGVTSYFAYALSDPASPSGTTYGLILSGNKPGIGPERATSWTAGADFRSGGFSAQVTYFDIDYRDRITNPATGLTTFLINRTLYAPIIDANPDRAAIAAYFASPFYGNYFGITAAQIGVIVDARRQNLSSQHQRGIDVDLGYRFDLAGGDFELGASGSYLVHYSQKLTASSPSITLVDTLGYPPDLRVRGRALYTSGGSGVAVFANYLDGYTNNSTGPLQQVGSWLTLDAQLSHRFQGGLLRNLKVALNVANLLDADPPLTVARSAFTTIGIDLENASPAGRIVSFQLSKQW
ncbi:MAG: TonB-dependent receptor [Sphingomonas sp.]